MSTPFFSFHLRCLAHAAKNDGAAQLEILSVGIKAFADLQGQLPGGGEDEGPNRLPRPLLGQPLEDGHAEGAGLSRPRLGAAQHIPAGQTGWDGFLVDHGGNLIPLVGEGGENGFRDPKG